MGEFLLSAASPGRFNFERRFFFVVSDTLVSPFRFE